MIFRHFLSNRRLTLDLLRNIFVAPFVFMLGGLACPFIAIANTVKRCGRT